MRRTFDPSLPPERVLPQTWSYCTSGSVVRVHLLPRLRLHSDSPGLRRYLLLRHLQPGLLQLGLCCLCLDQPLQLGGVGNVHLHIRCRPLHHGQRTGATGDRRHVLRLGILHYLPARSHPNCLLSAESMLCLPSRRLTSGQSQGWQLQSQGSCIIICTPALACTCSHPIETHIWARDVLCVRCAACCRSPGAV